MPLSSWLCLCLVLISGDSPTKEWSRFRGPNGTGHGSGFFWPGEWNQKAIVWKVPLPGEGHGSPIVHSGRLYLQAAAQEGQERLVLCLNAQDGKTIWRQQVPGARARMHKKNSLASGTGATDGRHVFFCHWDGSAVVLAAYACADGEPIWALPLGLFESQHGPGHSPIVHQDKVVVMFDSDSKAEVICVDAKSGKVRWNQKRPVFRASYGTPLMRQGGQGEEVVVASTAGLTGYDLEGGQIRWEWAWKFAAGPLRSVSSPVLGGNDMLLASAGDGGGDRDTVAVRLPNSGKASRLVQPTLVWQLRRDIPYVTCLLEQNKHVYFVADKGVAGCLEVETGKESWSQRLGGNFTSSPILIDGRIIAVNEDGELFVFAADPTKYQNQGKLRLGELVYATPALAEGRLFIRGQQHLFCIGGNP